jgi:cytochrome P450
MRPTRGFRLRGFVRARVLRFLVWLWPRVPARLRPSGDGLLDSLPEDARIALRRNGLDPVPALVSGAPVRRLRLPLGYSGWLVTGYDEVRAVLADSRTFSNDFGHLVGRPGFSQELDPGGLGVTDPPRHTELRRLLGPEFTARRLASQQWRVHEVVVHQLEVLAQASDRNGRVDLLAHFARPVPWLVICDLLGVSEADRAELLGLRDDRFDLGSGVIAPLAAMTGWNEHLRKVVARARTDPAPGLIARLVSAAGEDLDDARLAGVLDGLITGGLETTASMLALGAVVLMDDRETFEALQDPAHQPRHEVDELLRRLSVVQLAFPRFSRAEMRVGDETVQRDDVVICSLSAANHAVGRSAATHLAFGHGLHHCLGAELARMELETALPALVRRFPGLRLAVPNEELDFHRHSAVFGVRELPVVLGSR